MYECPNCGGGLRYDIGAGQLRCGSCEAQFDPYSMEKESDAEENDFYDVNSFTCPQCGGSIYSMDNTAAGFCSFCGASTILNSRLNRQARPAYVIPFSVSKEDCKKAYAKLMRKSWFAPKELKDESKIDGFRGIYMPYWIYNVEQKGEICLKGKKEHRSGDYIITEHYNLAGNLNVDYEGLSHDASADFADSISEGLAPYDTKKMQKFTPSFLCGFYADASDVDQKTYRQEMLKQSNQRTMAFLKKQDAFRGYGMKEPKDPTTTLHTACPKIQMAMFPVWFLSYRNQDRVVYATVNGQTGKVVSDIPIDQKKYLACSLATAVPIFVILNLFLTLRPWLLLVIVGVLALVSMILHLVEVGDIVRRDRHINDQGMQDVLKKKEKTKEETEKRKKEEKAELSKMRKMAWKECIPALIGIVVSAFVLLYQPIDDIQYYIPALLTMAGIYVIFYHLIGRFNMLCTRKLPQFDNQGGDDDA